MANLRRARSHQRVVTEGTFRIGNRNVYVGSSFAKGGHLSRQLFATNPRKRKARPYYF